MSGRDSLEPSVEQALTPLPTAGVLVGELVALADDGRTPLVLHPGQAQPAALRARSVVDLHGAHVGQRVLLAFEQGDPSRPVVMGVLRSTQPGPLDAQSTGFEVVADEERVVVSARSQLVLRCGKASITLTRAGKVLIEGAYVLNRSTGVNRVKGGSVQLN